jgi:hypothetical protein
MVYIVLILQNNEEARLICNTLEEAQRVKVSFENYGKCESISIEKGLK